jgi:hypothetical protein
MYKDKPVYVLEIHDKKTLIFPKEIVTDVFEQKVYIRCEHGLIPLDELSLPTHQDEAWISKDFNMSIFEIKEWGGRFTHIL